MNQLRTKVRVFDSTKPKNSWLQYPFVCLLIPFIGYPASHTSPFIGRKLPSIPFSGKSARYAGFSIIELLIALAVLGIMTAWAVPNFTRMMDQSTVTTLANNLVTDLNLARSEAIKRRATVGVCKTNNGATCIPAASWKDGWLIWIDTNGNNANDAGDTILRIRDRITSPRIFFVDNGNNGIIYGPSGMTTLVAQASIFACYDLDNDNDPDSGKMIEISLTGNAKTGNKAPAGC